ncbi:MAG TPA: hypothetical protein PLD27_07910 [bacterium]|nr:hypothetical protein [bacterium]HOL48074.1 hypothetical protein [bacterium]HPQ19095.1 hypothetical protein [bacterium]
MSKKDVPLPPRAEIKAELAKVSNFTEDELAILNWSSMYKAYSLIVRYGEKGVEDNFRKEEWFQTALKEYLEKKAAGLLPAQQEEQEEILDEKELKRRLKEKKELEREQRRKEKEAKRKEKEEEKERKKRVKDLEEKFEGKEFSVNEFYGFLNELAKVKDCKYDLELIDKALIVVKKNEKPYINILIKDQRLYFKRGEL